MTRACGDQRYGTGVVILAEGPTRQMSPEEPSMNAPKMCPHCATKLVDPVFLYASSSAWFAGGCGRLLPSMLTAATIRTSSLSSVTRKKRRSPQGNPRIEHI